MIRTAILGADTPLSGELIRILAMHPEVEIVGAQAKGLEGIQLSDVHHGLIGETDLQFSSSIDTSSAHVIFADASAVNVHPILQSCLTGNGPKMIIFGASSATLPDESCVYGLPEMNRKPLVRGAQAAVVPMPFASMALVALYPFASHLLLNDDIQIDVDAPETIIRETSLPKAETEIKQYISETQLSFTGNITLTVHESEARRSALMRIRFRCPLLLEQAMQLYDSYDDHRFAFVTNKEIGVSEVAGTDKCVISVSKEEADSITLTVVADCRMRGGAGEAVHIMNLMFGLHEKTGLYLKAIDFDKY